MPRTHGTPTAAADPERAYSHLTIRYTKERRDGTTSDVITLAVGGLDRSLA
jgi:hypothetical protein